MHIWVDADACPGVIKEILFRAAERVQVPLTLVANKQLRTPLSPLMSTMVVPNGFDAADEQIVDLVRQGDLVITADIPLAAKVIAKGAQALDPRGTFYSAENIQERLTLRNFMDQLRSSGVETGGPPTFNQGDRRAFANQLDRFLTSRGRTHGTGEA
jgi:uncharacterized protein YaiI (UPF0178 family)